MKKRYIAGAGVGFGAFAVFSVIINLAFWLGLAYGLFAIAQRFGVIG
jgi:hypothetical protein